MGWMYLPNLVQQEKQLNMISEKVVDKIASLIFGT